MIYCNIKFKNKDVMGKMLLVIDAQYDFLDGGNLAVNGSMEKMNKKGVVLNSAFAVSAAFAFGGHLALTMAFNPDYVIPMIIGKIISGIAAVILALLIYKEK